MPSFTYSRRTALPRVGCELFSLARTAAPCHLTSCKRTTTTTNAVTPWATSRASTSLQSISTADTARKAPRAGRPRRPRRRRRPVWTSRECLPGKGIHGRRRRKQPCINLALNWRTAVVPSSFSQSQYPSLRHRPPQQPQQPSSDNTTSLYSRTCSQYVPRTPTGLPRRACCILSSVRDPSPSLQMESQSHQWAQTGRYGCGTS